MIQNKTSRRIPNRPSGLPIRSINLSPAPSVPANVPTVNPSNSRSVPDLTIPSKCSIPKTTSYHTFKRLIPEPKPFLIETVYNKRKLSEVDASSKGAVPRAAKIPATVFAADCETVVRRLLDRSVAAVIAAETNAIDDSKRNSTDLDDSVGSFLSEQMDLLACDSSITRLHLLDRTPSVEDLPLEVDLLQDTLKHADANSTVVTSSQNKLLESAEFECSLECSTSSFSSSQKIANDGAMSVDTGYQGDGELSRPDSRNAESLSTADNNLLAHNKDLKSMAMTDSDFFTESDADDAATNRRAQIIDGTLYGIGSISASGRNGGLGGAPLLTSVTAVAPTATASEDMESSGVFSDLERVRDDGLIGEGEVDGDLDGRKGREGILPFRELISEQIRTIQSLVLEAACSTANNHPISDDGSTMVKSSSGDSSSTIQEPPTVRGTAPSQTAPISTKRKPLCAPLTKNTPHGNVSTAQKEQKFVSSIRRGPGRWDAVMDKIAQNKENNQFSAERFRNVKSKVFLSVNLQNHRGDSAYKTKSRKSTRVRNNAKAAAVAAAAAQSATTSVATCSTGSATSCSSRHSSISDLSIASSSILLKTGANKKRESTSVTSTGSSAATTASAVSTPRQTIPNKPNTNSNKLLSSQRRNDTQSTTKTDTSKARGDMKPPSSTRVRNTRLPASSLKPSNNSSKPLTDLNQNGAVIGKTVQNLLTGPNNNVVSNSNNNNINTRSNVHQRSTRITRQQQQQQQQQQQVEISSTNNLQSNNNNNEMVLLKKLLRESNRKAEAFAALIGYCTHHLDAFSTPNLRKQLAVELEKSTRLQSELAHQISKNEEYFDKITRMENDLTARTVIQSEMEQRFAQVQQQCNDLLLNERHLADLLATKCNRERILDDELQMRLATEKVFEERIAEFVDRERIFQQDLKDSAARFKIQRDRETALLSQLSSLRLENARLKESQLTVSPVNGDDEDRVVVNGTKNIECDIKEKKDAKDDSMLSICDVNVSVTGSQCQQTLVSEIESLRQVLALKTEEVTDLRRQQLHLHVEADRVPNLLSQIACLEAKLEHVQLQLDTQTTHVRELSMRNDQLRDEASHACAHAARIQQKNEELQYKLRVNSEAMWQLVATSSPASSAAPTTPVTAPASPRQANTKTSPKKTACRSIASTPRHEMKPLEQRRRVPEMVGVVEKSDSMSYVLDVDAGESPSDIVARVINRARARARTHDHVTTTPLTCQSDDASFVTCHGSPLPLTPADFSTDSVHVNDNAETEVIEISRSFDRVDACLSISTTSSSSSSSSGLSVEGEDDDDPNRFDIESEAYPDQEALLFAGEAMISDDEDIERD